MWNLEKWYRWSYLQPSRDTDVENKCVDTKGERDGVGMNWETGFDTIEIMYKIDSQWEPTVYSSGDPPQCSMVT